MPTVKLYFWPSAVAGGYSNLDSNISVFHYMHEQAEKLSELGRVRCGEMLRSTLHRFVDFRQGRDLTFATLDGEMMESFEAYLRRRGLMRNTIGFYMRTLCSCYNRAVHDGLAVDAHPFGRVYRGKDKTVKRALALAEIKRIKTLDLSSRPALDFARDMFMFSFYARGMSLIDMAYLKKSDLKGDHFTYSRRKTGQTLCIEWLWQMRRITDKYAPNDTCYLLPIITDDCKDARRQYLNKSQYIYRHLREVGNLAHVSGGVCTMYRARHSWATIARGSGVPTSVISEALGHDNEKTTAVYLDSIQTSVVDRANRQLLKEL